MARIVLGLAASHSTIGSIPPELWSTHARGWDLTRTDLLGRDGRTYDYATLLRTAGTEFVERAKPEHFAGHHRRIQVALERLAGIYAAAMPDVAIIVGEDQHEQFAEDLVPALLVYWGQEIPNLPRRVPDTLSADLRESLGASVWAYGTEEHSYPVASDLALHIIETLMSEGFDVAQSRRLPRATGVGHAFAFVYHRIMGGKVPPHVPVMLNTYVPPNQLSPARSHAIGTQIRRAVESFPADLRVAIVASGGLSHFVVNEELDRGVIDAMRRHDAAALRAIPREQMYSGTSEILNWIAGAAALDGLKMELVDYIPCYRSPAGTGVGMAYAAWR